MPKSLQIVGSMRSGGAERFFARLSDALHEHGLPVLAVTPPGSDVLKELRTDTPATTTPMRNVLDPLSRLGLSRLIRREGPDIVQTWMGRATRLVHLRRGLRPVHVARLGGYYKVDHYRHAHAWIGNTRGICDYLVREGIPADRVHHIGNFVDPPRVVGEQEVGRLRMAHEIPDDAMCILGVGRHHENKDFTTLIHAFAQLGEEHDHRPLRLVLVGDGPSRPALESQAMELGLADRLVMPGWQSDLAPWYALGDIFVCPSRHEPLGNVILEAWAHGIPVVATRTQGAEELVTGRENGLLVPIAEADAMAVALTELLDHGSPAWQELAAHGLATVGRHHHRDTVVAAYLHLYQELLGT
jgi:L-malate glycosyltransferase